MVSIILVNPADMSSDGEKLVFHVAIVVALSKASTSVQGVSKHVTTGSTCGANVKRHAAATYVPVLWPTLITSRVTESVNTSSQPLIFSQGVSPLGRNHRVLVAVVTAVVVAVVVFAAVAYAGRVVGVVRRLADAVENLGIVGAELVLQGLYVAHAGVDYFQLQKNLPYNKCWKCNTNADQERPTDCNLL